ncbi:hypothetical protein [Fredinandcohnia sp. 179-A 10B2 NHS]|uniref:hypothetical protein n=1 Tax=Fredinandcohnia sp. 179-A 10B2 NHS TaxID=3235176 RepID=UPI0039A3EDCD
MKQTEDLTQEAKKLLNPIKQRPNLKPDQAFVTELHNRILIENTKKKPKVNLVPLFAIATIILIVPLLILSTLTENESVAFDVEESSSIQLVKQIEYGSEKGDISLNAYGMNPVSSFDIKDGTLYLLDDAGSQIVVMSKDGERTSISIPKDQYTMGILQDILVTKNEDIYVVNSLDKEVYQFQADGKLVDTYDLSNVDLFFPDSLYELEDNEIIVGQNQEQFVSLETMDFINDKNLPFQFKRVNQKESKLLVNNQENQTELTLLSDLGLGNVSIKELTEDQILYMETITPPVFTPLSETHLYVLNSEGTKLGGARIPVETFIEKPQRVENYIKTDGNQIYLLIPEKEQISLYEVSLGKTYESFIEEQAKEHTIGYDYQTFGEPFPELEAEVKKLFTDNKIKYGNADSLNGVSIDEDGKVIIDFKDFLSGSPASAEAQSLFEALHSATFEKFPEIQQIYFQFDGSFSAWCHWLESTEEPWKRQGTE